MNANPPSSSPSGYQWWIRWVLWTALVALISVGVSVVVLEPSVLTRTFHLQTPVHETQAREVFYRTVGHVLIAGDHDLCATLGTHPASSCGTSAQRSGPPPGRAPGVQCVTQLNDGPFAGGVVLTIKGKDDLGQTYTTDFVVIDQGFGPQALDPVYWSGLHLVESATQPDESGTSSISWRYDGDSTRCN